MSEQKIIDLETRLAFMEDTLQTLNDIVYRQQLQMDKLNHRFNTLNNNLSQIQESMGSGTQQNEIPPHY